MVQWTEERKFEWQKQIVKTAAKLIRQAIRNFDNSTSTYPSTGDTCGMKNTWPPYPFPVLLKDNSADSVTF